MEVVKDQEMEKSFKKMQAIAKQMQEINEEVIKMSPQEFAVYISLVEVPHTATLNTMKEVLKRKAEEDLRNVKNEENQDQEN